MNVSKSFVFLCYIFCLFHFIDPFADDEISLQILLTCQMSTELALTRFRQLPVKTICKKLNRLIYYHFKYICISDSYPKWSLNEIQQFEEGLREYGKNFFKISVFKVYIIFCCYCFVCVCVCLLLGLILTKNLIITFSIYSV